VAVEGSENEGGAFLAVFAALLLDNALRLDETVSRVTDLVMSNGRPDRELVVTLQSFDRLKQEFEALGDALSRYAEASSAGLAADKVRSHLEENVIGAITVSDLKDRLLRRLQDDQPEVDAPPIADEQLAEVGVDVVY
jgi:hypothetical protein